MKHTSYLGMWMIWSWEMYPLSNERHCILVHEWDMKLGVAALQSPRKDLSNDVLKVDFNVGPIFEAGNCAVVISRKQLSNDVNVLWCPWFFMIWDQNSTCIKLDIIWMLHSCWSQWCNSQLHTLFTCQDMMCLSFDTGLCKYMSHVLC